MPKTTPLTEADILEQIIAPSTGNLPPEAARSLLTLKFNGTATRKIRKLLRLNNQGKITAEDRILLQKYLNVGQMLDLIKAKAQLSLQKTGAQ